MRIVAGEFRGRRLVAPPGTGTRPTSDRVRESLFSILGSVDGDVVLDLFAGTGALGIEALSRGAASAVAVERDRNAVRAIRTNAEALALGDRLRVVPRGWREALRAEAEAGSRFDLVLIDPPYDLLADITADIAKAIWDELNANDRAPHHELEVWLNGFGHDCTDFGFVPEPRSMFVPPYRG
jgi:16S rRNA (guanine966-N2)-methyltransferase